MSGTTSLAEKILLDVQAKIDKINADTEKSVEEILQKAQTEIEAEQLKLDAQCTADGEEINRRRLSVANLDAKKYQLSQKQLLVEKAYATAAEKLHEDGRKYLKLIGKLITRYAETGETVTICEGDKKRITKAYLDGFGKKLTLNSQYGDFSGGIILSSKGYDKNLTLEVVLRQIREESENEVIEILFGE